MQHYEDLDYWHFSMMVQTYAVLFGLIFLFIFFESSWFKNIVGYTLVVIMGLSSIEVFDNSRENPRYFELLKSGYDQVLMLTFGFVCIVFNL